MKETKPGGWPAWVQPYGLGPRGAPGERKAELPWTCDRTSRWTGSRCPSRAAMYSTVPVPGLVLELAGARPTLERSARALRERDLDAIVVGSFQCGERLRAFSSTTSSIRTSYCRLESEPVLLAFSTGRLSHVLAYRRARQRWVSDWRVGFSGASRSAAGERPRAWTHRYRRPGADRARRDGRAAAARLLEQLAQGVAGCNLRGV